MPSAEPLFQPFPMLASRRAQAWRHQPSYRRPRHFHEEPELNIVIRGHATMGVGEQRVGVTRGDVLFFQPGQDHELIEASCDLELYAIALSPSLAQRVGPFACALPARVRLEEGELQRMGEQLMALGGVSDPLATEAQLAELFAQVTPKLSRGHVLTRRALELLRSERALSEEEVAAHLRAHPTLLSRRFRRDFGVRFSEYRARLRLMEFIKLVDAGRPLSHAALDADFGSYAQCHRVFRRFVGVAPHDYFAGERWRVDSAVVDEASKGPQHLRRG